MNPKAKNGIITTTVITLVLVILFNVIFFAIPIPVCSGHAHWINYGMTSFVLGAQGVIFAVTMFGEKDAQARVLGIPVIYSGFVTLGVQLLISGTFLLINAFVGLPFYVVVIVEALILAYMIINFAKGFFFRSHAQSLNESTDKATAFMDIFRARLQALSAINQIESIARPLEDLTDIARGSDPMTNEYTLASESKLLELLQKLDDSIKAGDEEDSVEILVAMRNTLLERNALCKVGK